VFARKIEFKDWRKVMLAAREWRPLATDLAVSKTLVAALKAASARSLGDQELLRAAELKDFLENELRALEKHKELSEEVVPRQTMRDQLRQTLASLPPIEKKMKQVDKTRLKETIRLLGKLIDHQLSNVEASSLVSCLLKYGSVEHRQEKLPDLALDTVYESRLGDATSTPARGC
jgi:hypothetical protein